MKKLALTIAAALVGAVAASAADAGALWDQHCASCHAKDGSGNTRMGKKSGVKDYRDAKVQGEFDDAAAAARIKDGVSEGGKEKMKPYKDKLSDDEIKALVAHVRSFGKK